MLHRRILVTIAILGPPLTMVLSTFVYSEFNQTVLYLLVAYILAWAALVDIATRQIPLACHAGLYLLGMIHSFSSLGLRLIVAAGVLLILLIMTAGLEAVTKAHSLGGGDIKLYASLFMVLEPYQACIVLLIAQFFSIPTFLISYKGGSSVGVIRRPMAPFLFLAFVVFTLMMN